MDDLKKTGKKKKKEKQTTKITCWLQYFVKKPDMKRQSLQLNE